MVRRIDLTPRHKRLTFSAARGALEGVIDYGKFAVTFIDVKGELGWLLEPATVGGRVQALAAVPLRILSRGRRSAVLIDRLRGGKIPIRIDTRLLKNLESLKP